jgi:hypothetical protein
MNDWFQRNCTFRSRGVYPDNVAIFLPLYRIYEFGFLRGLHPMRFSLPGNHWDAMNTDISSPSPAVLKNVSI